MSILGAKSAAKAQVLWEHIDGKLTPINSLTRKPIAWAPQPGSAEAFLCSTVPEVLYTGPRGSGKTDSLLMSFAQHVEHGYGAEWRGVLFRRSFPELGDVIAKSRRWFPIIFGGRCKFNAGHSEWVWKSGERLLFRHFVGPETYASYHGHNYTWIGWEELTTWPTPEGYLSMFSCNRSSYNGIPLQVRSTTNPWGCGFSWVKRRFRLPVPPRKMLGEYILDGTAASGDKEPPRIAINSSLAENRMLLEADPGYIQRIRTSAANPYQAEAWLTGSWDIVSGGLLDDVWQPEHHVLSDLRQLPIRQIPRAWTITRSFDMGTAKPFAVLWWATSNGEPLTHNGKQYGTIKGDVFLVAEWYGCKVDEDNVGVRISARSIAEGILEREQDWGISGRVEVGPADGAIFNPSEVDQKLSVASDMLDVGVQWVRADKGPGSRPAGWLQLRKYLEGAVPDTSGLREFPGLFVLPRCPAWVNLVPTLPRDDKKPDDTPPEAIDHLGDATRYFLRFARPTASSFSWK